MLAGVFCLALGDFVLEDFDLGFVLLNDFGTEVRPLGQLIFYFYMLVQLLLQQLYLLLHFLILKG